VDKLVTTARERLWNPEAFARDRWIQAHAEKLAAGSRVLDAGAGASKYRPFFAHCQYQTQDFCQYAGELVKYLQPIDHVCEITAIPLPDASLDAILCTEVIEHVVDPAAVLAEFARLLKPGGKLLLTAPLLSYLHMEPYHYYGGFTHYWYRYWLPAKGFKIDSLTSVGGPGQVCSALGRAFDFAWSGAEKKAPLIRRWISRGVRAFLWPWVYYVLPWLLPKFDPMLGDQLVCCEYMVAATRLPAVQ
jgi:SAM-dependent methyltransferase